MSIENLSGSYSKRTKKRILFVFYMWAFGPKGEEGDSNLLHEVCSWSWLLFRIGGSMNHNYQKHIELMICLFGEKRKGNKGEMKTPHFLSLVGLRWGGGCWRNYSFPDYIAFPHMYNTTGRMNNFSRYKSIDGVRDFPSRSTFFFSFQIGRKTENEEILHYWWDLQLFFHSLLHPCIFTSSYPFTSPNQAVPYNWK